MSTFIATTTATSSLTARGIRPALLSSTTPLKFFSTTRTLLTTNPTTNPTPNPSYPKFSLKRISPNPRVRMALGAGLVVMVAAEGYAWVKFWPKISGRWKEGSE